MIISSDSEREAAVRHWVIRVVVRAFDGASGDETVVGLVKRYCSELFPVSHIGFFCQYLMQRNLALGTVSVLLT